MNNTPAGCGTEKRAPGRPRSEATRQAIIDAALELLDNEPYRLISIDKIAATAKVGKQSIYRWWCSKAELILEAYLTRAAASVPMISTTGDALVDLESTLKRLCTVLSQERAQKSLRSFVAEAQLDEEFRPKFYALFVARRYDMFGTIIERGIVDGQLRGDVDLEAVLDMTLGAIWFRVLSGTPHLLDERFAETLSDVLRAYLAKSPEAARRPERGEVLMFEA